VKIFLSAAVGGVIAVMILFNGVMAREAGTYLGCALIHLVGLLIMLVLYLGQADKSLHFRQIPWFLYTAGAIGIATVVFTNWSFIGLGVSLTMALGLLGQSLVSIVIDHYGLFEMRVITFARKKLIGLALIFGGIVVMCLW